MPHILAARKERGRACSCQHLCTRLERLAGGECILQPTPFFPHILVGNEGHAKDYGTLLRHGITHIVNAAKLQVEGGGAGERDLLYFAWCCNAQPKALTEQLTGWLIERPTN
jgi:hypothetical protein